MFARSLNVKQFYMNHRQDSFRCYHSGTVLTRERWQWRGTLLSPIFQHFWSLNFWLFSVISRVLVEEVLPLCWDAVGVFYSPNWLGWPNDIRRKFLTVVCVNVIKREPPTTSALVTRLCDWLQRMNNDNSRDKSKKRLHAKDEDFWKKKFSQLVIGRVSDKIKREFLQAVAVSVLLYGCPESWK